MFSSLQARRSAKPVSRSLLNTRHGLKHQRSASGSMLGAEQRQIGPMALPISWNIWPSRSGSCLENGMVRLTTVLQGTTSRTQQQLELEIENMGGHLNAYTSVYLRTPNFTEAGLTVTARKHCVLCKILQLRCSSYRQHPLRYPPKLQARAIGH